MKKFAFSVLAVTILLNALPAYAQTQEIAQTQETAQAPEMREGRVGGFILSPVEPNAIKPSAIIAEIKPGTTYEEFVTVENPNDFSATLSAYAVDGTVTSKNEFTVKLKSDEQKDIGLWTTVEPAELEIGPHEKVMVKVTITVPEDAAEGLYKGGVVAQHTAQTSATVVKTLRVAMLLQVTVTQDPHVIPRQVKTENYQPIYLAASIIIFILCMTYFFWANHKEKKHAKHAHHEHRHHE